MGAQVFVIQEGLLSCDMELVVEWMSLHLPKDMVCEELLRSSAQNFDEYIERALILNGLKKYEFNESEFLYQLHKGRVEKFAKRAFPHMQDEFVQDVRVATRAMKVAAKTETSTLEAFAKLTYESLPKRVLESSQSRKPE